MTPDAPNQKPAKYDANDVAGRRGPEGLQAAAERVAAGAPVSGGVAATCRSLGDWLKEPEVLNPPPRIPTTYKAIDHALDGGFVVGGLYLVVGLTGRGKSTLALNMARRMAAAGTRVLLVSLEDCPPSAARRMIAQEARQPLRAVEAYSHPGLDTRHVEAIDAAVEKLRSLPLEIEGDVSDLAGLEGLIRLKAETGTQVVILDQSSWVAVPGAQTFYQEASEISRRLKRLAAALKIVMVILVQVNRAGAGAKAEGKDIELYHIRETGRWEQDCDGALILQSIETSTDPAVLRVDLKKHRHGPGELCCHLLFTMPQNLVEDDPDSPDAARITPAQVEGDAPPKPEWTAERFATEVVPAEWTNTSGIVYLGLRAGLKAYTVREMLKVCESLKLCEARGGSGRVQKEFKRVSCV